MERLKLKYNDATKALETLKDVLNEEYNIVVRDATIQRFEFTFEATWKYVKEYLKVKEGVVSNSPKSCFRELFSLGHISEDKVMLLLDMTDKRNLTSHTYKEKVAEIIFANIKNYILILDELLTSLSI